MKNSNIVFIHIFQRILLMSDRFENLSSVFSNAVFDNFPTGVYLNPVRYIINIPI